MAQAVIIDIVVAALLLLFTMMGAQKGLLKSVAGLVILVLSLVGAALLSNMITPFISQAVQPMLVEAVESRLAQVTEELKTGEIDLGEIDLSNIQIGDIHLGDIDLSNVEIGGVRLGDIDLSNIGFGDFKLGDIDLGDISLPENITLPDGVSASAVADAIGGALAELDPAEQLNALLTQLGIDPVLAAGLAEAALEKVTGSGVSIVEALVQVVVETIVHAIVFLLAFVALNILLRIMVAAMDLVLLLPGLRTLNTLGGACVALVEGALLLFLLVWVARQCAADVTGLAKGTVLFRFFVNNTPLSVLSLL